MGDQKAGNRRDASPLVVLESLDSELSFSIAAQAHWIVDSHMGNSVFVILLDAPIDDFQRWHYCYRAFA
jgi:hypothetical protein